MGIPKASEIILHTIPVKLKEKMLINSANMLSQNNCLVWLFNGISTLFRLFNSKAILPEEQ